MLCVVLAALAWVLVTSGTAVWFARAITAIEQQPRRPEDLDDHRDVHPARH